MIGRLAPGQDLCRLHGHEGQAGRAKGRQAALQARAPRRYRLDTPRACRRLIEQAVADLQAGKITAGTANALDRMARTALAAVDSALLEAATEAKAKRRA